MVEVSGDIEASRVGYVADALDRVRQLYCGLSGHDELLAFAPGRLFLVCTSCGHESPGWIVEQWEGTGMAKADRGFASMDRNRQREIASMGGKKAQALGTAHQWTAEEAAKAGAKGAAVNASRRRAADALRGES